MLVLSRKVGNQIVSADNIRVTVLEVSGNQVRLGFSAPCQIAIRRSELEDAKRREGEPAQGVTPTITGLDSGEQSSD